MPASTLHAAATKVICTNCDGTDWPTLAVAVVALVVAVGSLAISWNAFRIQSREHEEFLTRPEISFEPRTLPEAGDDGVIRLAGPRSLVRVDLGIRNIGDRAAENVTVNILLPRTLSFFLSDSHGSQLDRTRPSTDTTELLQAHRLDGGLGLRTEQREPLARLIAGREATPVL